MASKQSQTDTTVAKSFEQQTYDYARNWALSRRGFLQSAAVSRRPGDGRIRSGGPPRRSNRAAT